MARTHDMDRKHMMEMFRRAHEHKGAAFVEIYQNCNVFNDGAFEAITAKEARAEMLIELAARRADPLRRRQRARRRSLNEFGECEIVEVADVGEDRLLVHDEHRDDPALAFALVAARRRADDADADRRVPRRRAARSYEGEVQRQLVAAVERQGPGDLAALIGSGATWTVE